MPTKTAAKSGAKKKLTWNDEVNARLRTLEVDNVKKGTRIASLRKLVEQHRSDTLTALRNLGTQTENIRERLTALEQAAKPKEVDPTVEETVDELMELLEDYIEEGIGEMHDHSSDHGWQYDRGHPNWNATMDDLRARLKTLFP